MGNASKKKKKTEPTSKIGKSFSCPFCFNPFTHSTTYSTVNSI